MVVEEDKLPNAFWVADSYVGMDRMIARPVGHILQRLIPFWNWSFLDADLPDGHLTADIMMNAFDIHLHRET